jgi:hypothetical protein
MLSEKAKGDVATMWFQRAEYARDSEHYRPVWCTVSSARDAAATHGELRAAGFPSWTINVVAAAPREIADRGRSRSALAQQAISNIATTLRYLGLSEFEVRACESELYRGRVVVCVETHGRTEHGRANAVCRRLGRRLHLVRSLPRPGIR